MNLKNKILEILKEDENLFKPRRVDKREEELVKRKESLINILGKGKIENIWCVDVSYKERNLYGDKQITGYYYVNAKSKNECFKIIKPLLKSWEKISDCFKVIDYLNELESFYKDFKITVKNNKTNYSDVLNNKKKYVKVSL